MRRRAARSLGIKVRVALFAACALILAGCGTVPCKPETVMVPVSVGCLGDTSARPASLRRVGEYPGGKAAAQAALIDADAWESYSVTLEAAMAGCRKKQDQIQ